MQPSSCQVSLQTFVLTTKNVTSLKVHLKVQFMFDFASLVEQNMKQFYRIKKLIFQNNIVQI